MLTCYGGLNDFVDWSNLFAEMFDRSDMQILHFNRSDSLDALKIYEKELCLANYSYHAYSLKFIQELYNNFKFYISIEEILSTEMSYFIVSKVWNVAHNVYIISAHNDDEFFAYLAAYRYFKENMIYQTFRVIFLTDSSSMKYLKDKDKYRDKYEYSQVRKKESERFCKEHNIEIVYSVNQPDGKLGFKNWSSTFYAIDYFKKDSSIVMAPAIKEHRDHDIAFVMGKDIQTKDGRKLYYTVTPDNEWGIKEYRPYTHAAFNKLVDAFYFWYPSQRNNFFPSFYGGYLKDL